MAGAGSLPQAASNTQEIRSALMEGAQNSSYLFAGVVRCYLPGSFARAVASLFTILAAASASIRGGNRTARRSAPPSTVTAAATGSLQRSAIERRGSAANLADPRCDTNIE